MSRIPLLGLLIDTKKPTPSSEEYALVDANPVMPVVAVKEVDRSRSR